MSADPEVGCAVPASVGGSTLVCAAISDADRRVVAIAADAVELLRPESDMARLLDSFGRADVLLAAEDVPSATGDDGYDEDDLGELDDEAYGEVVDELPAGVAALGHPDLMVHRLALDAPLSPAIEDDLVAALSELVGFDPEPGVYCLAPATPQDGVLMRAARRIARVYGLPLLRYRCLELSLVGRADADDVDAVSLPSPRHAARG